MDAFKPAGFPPLSAPEIADRFGLSLSDAEDQILRLQKAQVFMNDRFQVNITRVPEPFGPELGDILWLSIKRRNKSPVHNWRDLQQIKNMLVGPENEGFEVYPAESRLVDEANQYHLWVFEDAKVRLPVGFTARSIGTPEQAAAAGAGQKPF